MSEKYNGSCFCGAVKLELSGESNVMGFCHCSSCRSWSGDPIHAWTVWSADQLKITDGESLIGTFLSSPESISHRQFCTKCGSQLMIHHPTLGIYDVKACVIDDFEFKPTMHVNYAETVQPMKDGLPKYKDFPSEFEAFGNTGELMPE